MEAAYYGLQHTKKVIKVSNHSREFPSKRTGGIMKVHHVIFEGGFAGEFFSTTEVLKHKNGTPVVKDDIVCYIPTQTIVIDGLDKLTMCDEGTQNTYETDLSQSPKKPSVQNTAISFATRYATDCSIARFQGQDVSAEKQLEFITTLALGLKDLMEKNV